MERTSQREGEVVMSRVLRGSKRKRPTLDYALWEEVGSKASLVNKEQGKFLADRDRGASSRSNYFTKEGRNRAANDPTKVYDFVSLSKSFDPWFDELRLNRTNLLADIEDKIVGMRGSQVYFHGVGEDWLELDWNTLARVIGAATANIGNSEGWWSIKGSDAHKSLQFWGELDRNIPRVSDGMGIPESKWENIAVYFREHNFDPNSEILRAFSHRPSAPFWKVGEDDGVRYYPNPLALLHRKRLKVLYKSQAEWNEDVVEEISKFHGKLTMKLINRAMVSLSRGDIVDFALRIHGVCAFHVMRTVVTQQKIGLHLISNLAIRKQTRGVGAQNVPDIAYHLATAFHLAKVMHILQRSKLIDWYTVEKEVVDAATDLLA